ncbi:phytanoyl-CoA dioxygenase family protein [Massilia atriviolacea]|uniref:Uncharacterized protein n=1 Tax=Massilia atriviolacea TaxID=2495579 RepID=A0A430HDL1_9BURK|nr:hypothetical protein EJB06_28625 [Massilia atriviolacea]
MQLARLGRVQESTQLCRAECDSSADGRQWLNTLIVEAMEAHDLTLAGTLARILAILERASDRYPGGAQPPAAAPPPTTVSLAKLQHDIGQFRHLRALGVLDARFDQLIARYADAHRRLAEGGADARTPLTPELDAQLGRTCGRIVHLADAPRLPVALSRGWDRARAERLYLEQRPGVVVIDDFLSPQALDSLQRFCTESTVWFGNRYAHGRLGALFFSGFNCPLLLQLAEEIRDAFPALIGARHPLRQLWGFKNTGALPPDSTLHADFAAVNVNFWITPEAANLDQDSGGMLIYDVDAPASWDFATYNERIDLIREYLERRQARVIRIPYRQNRAIIFDSDLFHATEAVRFKPDYLSHRINVTMLYGERQFDQHHRPAPAAEPLIASAASWRSAALSRRRP